MALQDEAPSTGWPFGLRPLNLQLRLEEFRMDDPSLIVAPSPSFSSKSSSGLETESTASFFRDKSITLASLIGFTYGNSLKHSRNSSLWQSRNSCSAQGMWFPHFKRNKKRKSWLTSFWNLLSCQRVKQKQDWWIDSRDSPPSLAKILNLEEPHQSSVPIRVFTNGVYDDCVGSSLHESDTSLDPLDARSSDEQGVNDEGCQSRAAGSMPRSMPIIRAQTKSAIDDKSHFTGGGCMICFRTSLTE